jgi:hypothetical protein
MPTPDGDPETSKTTVTHRAMKDQASRDAIPLFGSLKLADTAVPRPVDTNDEVTVVPQPQGVVPGAASRWWDSHPADLPQSTVLWNDEPGPESTTSPVSECLASGTWGV